MITVKVSLLLTGFFLVKCNTGRKEEHGQNGWASLDNAGQETGDGLLSTEVEGQCEDGWHGYQDRCYYFSKTRLSWDNASDACMSELNAQLATIKTPDVQLFIAGVMESREYWIGLTDLANESTWTWVDGTEFQPSSYFRFWSCGEPNDRNMDEHCVHLARQFTNVPRGLWNDNTCNISFHYLCEKAAAQTKPTRSTAEPSATKSIPPETVPRSTTSDVTTQGVEDHYQRGLLVGVGIGVGATLAFAIVCSVVAFILLRKRKLFVSSTDADGMGRPIEEKVPRSLFSSESVAANSQTNGAVAPAYDSLQMSDVGNVSTYSQFDKVYNKSCPSGETDGTYENLPR